MSDFLAVDLGATSGRIAIGRVNSDSITVEVIHRFSHEVIAQPDGSLFWNWELIFEEVLAGLRAAIKQSNPISLAVDSWAVDYGFINKESGLLGPIYAYRDARNSSAAETLQKNIGKERIYKNSGIQFLPFNTIYQLFASRELKEYKSSNFFLMIPDLINFLLTGKISTEITNASTTQALDTSTRSWDKELIDQAGIRLDIFSNLHEPGKLIGKIKDKGVLNDINVVSVASHDTASAVAAVPFDDTMSEAFISSGTWSLVGIEANQPIKNEEAFSLNLTNELGVYGTVRILKNVTGMWLLEECRRQWLSEGVNSTISKLLIDAENCDIKSVIDPNDPVFMAPGRMPERIAQYCMANKMQEPKTIGEFTFVILNSLAHSYKKTLDEISSVTGRKISTIHVIGGGSQIELLNRLTADVCQVVVKTGPVEATLFGNIAVQAITAGIYPDIQTARKIIERSVSRNIVIPNN